MGEEAADRWAEEEKEVKAPLRPHTADNIQHPALPRNSHVKTASTVLMLIAAR